MGSLISSWRAPGKQILLLAILSVSELAFLNLLVSAGLSSMATDLTSDSSFTAGDGSSLISVLDIMVDLVSSERGTMKEMQVIIVDTFRHLFSADLKSRYIEGE